MLILSLLSSFVLAFLGVVLMVHFDLMLGILLAITGCICVLRSMYDNQQLNVEIMRWEGWQQNSLSQVRVNFVRKEINMAEQTTFVERTPEEKKAWVVQQRALGNKNILSERDWYKKNEIRIRMSNLEQKIDGLVSMVSKFTKSK